MLKYNIELLFHPIPILVYDVCVPPAFKLVGRVSDPKRYPDLSAASCSNLSFIPLRPILAVDCGFDIVPRLTDAQTDGKRWDAFINDARQSYENDPVVKVQSQSIEFDVGEHPSLPLDGRRFQRFSSRVHGHATEAAETYIDRVCRIAHRYFDSQIRFWHETQDARGGKQVDERLQNASTTWVT